MQIEMKVLPRRFYINDTKQVARNLLGKKLVRKIGRHVLSGIIIETEAYKGRNDPASHAARKKTERNKIMFGEAGHAYVYFTYGMHHCFNVVAKNFLIIKSLSKCNAGALVIFPRNECFLEYFSRADNNLILIKEKSESVLKKTSTHLYPLGLSYTSDFSNPSIRFSQ